MQYHPLNAIEQYCNTPTHQYDTDISFSARDRSMLIYDIREDDSNNWPNETKPMVYRDVSKQSIRTVRSLVDIRIEINVEVLDLIV
jgi:hypothetical protein